jgi:hypothetical protein
MPHLELLAIGVELFSSFASELVLLSRDGTGSMPFLSPEWFTSLAANFKIRMEAVTVRREGRLIAALPVERLRRSFHGLPVRKVQGVFNLNSQRFDLIHEDREEERGRVAEAVWEGLKTSDRWDVFECRLVRSDSCLHDLLKLARDDGYATGVWPMETAPFINVPRADQNGSIDSYFTGPRKRMGKELNRRLARLKEVGHVEFLNPDADDPKVIRRYLELEAKGWKGRRGTAAVQDARAEGLHLDFAQALAEKKSLSVYELRVSGRTIAMSLNIRQADTVYHWKTSYDEEFSKYAPGNLLFRKLLTDLAVQGVKELDFLCPSLPYKKSWATGEREYSAIYIFDPGFLGWLSWHWKFTLLSRLRSLRRSRLS